MPRPIATTATPLLPDRAGHLDRATADADAGLLDVLVVGGGATGVGIALDAVTRGYRVALVERDDLAAGTSSRSSKLVHGGVRYLEHGDLAMVAEGVRERDRLRRLAPHLVVPLAFVLPLPDATSRLRLAAGLTVYDAIAAGRNVRRHRWLSVADTVRRAPGLARGFGHGAMRYHDAQTDDARLVLQVAQVARAHGADVVTHADAVELLRRRDGRVVGARVRDRFSGAEVDLRARWVVSATGVWAGRVRGLAGGGGPETLTPSRGVHLTLRRRDVPVEDAVVLPSGAGDGRSNFVVPWGEQVYVGTTDERYVGDLDAADLPAADAAYLLDGLNAAFGTTLTAADAIGAWAGLRPLLTGPAGATRDLSRRHAIVEDPPGLVTVTGGKLTTYRQMSEDVVDRLAAGDGNRHPCRTARLPLGARGGAGAGVGRVRAVVTAYGLDPALAAGLYHRHGDAAPTVVAACAAIPGGAEPLVPGLPYLRGEVDWAVRNELACTVDDVLQRRLRVSLRDPAAGGSAIRDVASTVQAALGLDDATVDAQVDDYLRRVAHERGPVPLDTSWR